MPLTFYFVLQLFFPIVELQNITNKQKIIDELLIDYDKGISPTEDVGNGPVVDYVQLYILSLDFPGDKTMDFEMSFFLRQRWKDSRLTYNISGVTVLELDQYAIDAVWVPDIYFLNEKSAKFHNVFVPNRMLNILPEGELLHSIRVTGTYSCHMDLRKYPLDKQICSLTIESYGHSTKYLEVRWTSTPALLSPSIKLTQFTVDRTVPYICDRQYMEYNYSCIGLDLYMTRMNGFYFTHMYVPSILIVTLSWVSFWIDIEATAARTSLGILTVLAMTTQNEFIKIQNVSYITAMNVWTAASLAFVFLAVIEFAYINVQTRQHLKKTLTKVSSTSNSNNLNDTIKSNISIPTNETNGIQVSEKKYTLDKMDMDNKRGRTVDRHARVAFPLCYILFNVVYWSVYFVWEPVKDKNH
ncbi:glycine receptor subunit alpha-2-like [Saccostrea echinata]|uniref:glycine receptor subunit alpha-2-like n=1 Tax=Saccostrea echinata TaxID=191078 RepID=UPI002A8226AD|nr:glycine receptor subunit alpha-2-like [Saccostrea echinata]